MSANQGVIDSVCRKIGILLSITTAVTHFHCDLARRAGSVVNALLKQHQNADLVEVIFVHPYYVDVVIAFKGESCLSRFRLRSNR